MNIINKINQHWSKVSKSVNIPRTRWWESALIKRHINRIVCDKSINGFSQGLIELAKSYGKTFKLGISVGCGTGQKEMQLIQQGLVENFILFEFSDERIRQGKELSKKLGLQEQVEFRKEDYFESKIPNNIDFVHWNNALHHMFDVYQAVKWSHDILISGGMFFMDDFVGPARFQWSDESLSLSTRIRHILPDRYLINPRDTTKLLNRNSQRPDPIKLANDDPSEAVESDKIIDAIKKYFPHAEIKLTGGSIYHTCLNDVIHNLHEEDETDKTILELLLLIDELSVHHPQIDSHYAIAIAIKR